MIYLGGIEISDNMYLDGINDAALSASSQKRLLGGGSVVFIQPQIGGITFTLGSQTQKGIQGIWCQNVIDLLKPIEALATAVILDYHGDLYDVVIKEMTFTPIFQNQSESTNKIFTGTITLIEV